MVNCVAESRSVIQLMRPATGGHQIAQRSDATNIAGKNHQRQAREAAFGSAAPDRNPRQGLAQDDGPLDFTGLCRNITGSDAAFGHQHTRADGDGADDVHQCLGDGLPNAQAGVCFGLQQIATGIDNDGLVCGENAVRHARPLRPPSRRASPGRAHSEHLVPGRAFGCLARDVPVEPSSSARTSRPRRARRGRRAKTAHRHSTTDVAGCRIEWPRRMPRCDRENAFPRTRPPATQRWQIPGRTARRR